MSDTKIYGEGLCNVGCTAENCKYHASSGCCSAERIVVRNENAMRKAETFCSTFEPR